MGRGSRAEAAPASTPIAADVTQDELAAIVAFWIPKLGLERWDIQIEWDEKEWRELHGDDSSGPDASMHRSRDYDQASILFNPNDYAKWPPLKAHRIVVHELLHALTRDVEHVLDLLDGHLHRDVESVLRATHRHAIEGAVDRLAYRFVEIAGVDADAPDDALERR